MSPISVNYGDGQTHGYTFDPMGNRLTKTDNVAGNDTYTHNAANMLLSRNGGSYTNDLNGNTLTGGGRTNTWDGQNRLTACTFNGTTTNHTYGADGLRRRTVQGANTTDFVLDGQSVVRTFLNSAVEKTVLHGMRGPEYERLGANDPVWYLYDGLGSVLGTVDKNGNVVSTRKYDVYGAVRGSTGPNGTTHKFVGLLGHPSEDETGLIYMRARYYDPLLGRFAGQDPARDGVNWFLYCANNPTNGSDSTGCIADFPPVGSRNPFAFPVLAWAFRLALLESVAFRPIAAEFLALWSNLVGITGALGSDKLLVHGAELMELDIHYAEAIRHPGGMTYFQRLRGFYGGYSTCLLLTMHFLDLDSDSSVPYE